MYDDCSKNFNAFWTLTVLQHTCPVIYYVLTHLYIEPEKNLNLKEQKITKR